MDNFFMKIKNILPILLLTILVAISGCTSLPGGQINSTPNKQNIKTMTIGDSINLGSGYSFKVISIGTSLEPGVVQLAIYKNGNQISQKSINEGEIFEIENDNNITIFKAKTLVVYSGTTSDMVDFEIIYT